MKSQKIAAWACSVIVVFGVAVPDQAFARWRADWGLTYNLLFTDNIAREPTDEIDEFVHIPRATLFLTEDTGRLTGNVNLSVERRFYQDDTFDNEDRNYLDLNLLLKAVDGRLDWVFEDELREQPINIRVNNRPDNLQQVNVFRTGPNVYFRLGRSIDGQVRVRYVDTYAEEQKRFDSQRGQVGATLQRRLSESTVVSLNAGFEDTDFEEDQSSDYVQRSVYGSWENIRRKDTFNVDLGWAEADVRGGQEFDADDILFDASWTRREARQQYGIDLFHGITSLAQLLGGTEFAVGTNVVTNRVTERDSITFRYLLEQEIGSSWSASLQYAEDNFVGEDLFDREQLRFNLRYSRPLTDRSDLAVFVNYFDIEFTAGPFAREDDRTVFGFRYSKLFSPHLSGGLEVRYTDQGSTDPAIEFDETRVGLTITYRRNPEGTR